MCVYMSAYHDPTMLAATFFFLLFCRTLLVCVSLLLPSWHVCMCVRVCLRTCGGAGKKKGEARVEWIPNGLRHSYGSYRLGQVQDVAKVSFEMGNSPQVVHRHYKELVTEAQAKAWFDLRPAASEVLAPAFRA